MDESSAFLAAVMPPLSAAETALHNGDAGPRQGLWSSRDPVTLFGAVMTKSGPVEVSAAFDLLASKFSHCTSFEYDVIASGASGDLAYIVGIEHTTASVGGADPLPYALRVTTIFRRENGEWKIIHRHGDALPDGDPSGNNAASTRVQLGRLATADSPDHSQ